MRTKFDYFSERSPILVTLKTSPRAYLMVFLLKLARPSENINNLKGRVNQFLYNFTTVLWNSPVFEIKYLYQIQNVQEEIYMLSLNFSTLSLKMSS